MIAETIAVKVRDGEMYVDMLKLGFESGIVIKCPNCEVEYRLFHRPPVNTSSLSVQAMEALSLETNVENSHPDHPDRVMLTGF